MDYEKRCKRVTGIKPDTAEKANEDGKHVPGADVQIREDQVIHKALKADVTGRSYSVPYTPVLQRYQHRMS